MTRTGRAQQPFKSVVLVAFFGLTALTVAAPANATCLDGLLRQAAPSKSSTPLKAAPSVRTLSAVYHPGEAPGSSSLKVADRSNDGDGSIVGLWEFQLDGAPPDFGTQAWHSDGTELMFSAGRNPATGDVCQGVWRQIGPRTYSLNHIAMGWDFGYFGLRVHIHAVVTVDRAGNTYSGTYTAAAYAVTPENPFDESSQIGGGTGTITGARVRPD
jgi:hypothetical protein